MYRQFLTASISSVIFAMGMGGASVAQEITFDGICDLRYEDELVGSGECTAMQEGELVTIKGTISENNQKYTAIINNDENSGLLLGAGTFTLAEGELVSNEDTKVVFANSYTIEMY